MSRHDNTSTPEPLVACGEIQPTWFDTRSSTLGTGLVIRRALPLRKLRMIGAWCFLDHFGPHAVGDPHDAMWVGPHPHTGLQTVTWLLEGEVLHRDSIGSEAVIRPGQLNVMTAGRGISHTEETPHEHSDRLHGVQFWVALPDAARDISPAFAQHEDLPWTEHAGATVCVFIGRGFGAESVATAYSPLVGAEVRLHGAASLPLEPGWEYGVKSLDGPIEVCGAVADIGQIVFVPAGTRTLALSAPAPTRLVVVGGEPFDESILLWWNFVGRSQEEIVEYVRSWNDGTRFGEVHGFSGDRLLAPELRGVRLS